MLPKIRSLSGLIHYIELLIEKE